MAVTLEAGTPESLGGRFLIERVVGRGGVGVVYRAYDQETCQHVALKVVAAEAGVAPRAEERLAREGRVLLGLSHPGIVRVVATGRLEDIAQPFVAMEWLEGEDLQARHKRQPLSYSQSLELAMHVANALVAAHDAGIVHRDIKPSNIFLSSTDGEMKFLDATPKLVDFGVAMVEDVRVTHGGDVVGTPAYMSPEQARGDGLVDLRCDIYSLGATLFELLTNRPPHVGPTAIATLARLVTTPPPRLRELRRDVPVILDQLVHHMLSSEPMDRPGSAQEVADALRILLTQSENDGLSLDEPPMVSSRLGSSASRLVTSVVAIGFSSSASRDAALLTLRRGGAVAVPLGPDAIVAHLGATRAVGREATVALELGRDLARAGARVGIASGRARIDLLSPDGSVQPVGVVVDRASALARDAQSGAVLADATTSELGRGRYEFRARDDGSAVVGDQLSAGPRGDRSGGTPFVGRDPELAQVVASLERSMNDSTPVIVSVTGPPGIGKTRLRREVLARIAAQHKSPRVFLQRSDAYGQRHALGAAADTMRSLLGLAKGASVEDAERSIIEELGPETQHEVTTTNREVLARLLADKALPHGIDPRGARDVLWLAMTDLLLHAIGREPTVIVLEDLQWADAESVGWLDHLVGRATGRPLVVLALVRNDFWTSHAGRFAGRDHVRLELRPISKKASRAIARSYLGETVSDDVLERIANQAAGSPLFAEELSRLAAAGGDTRLAPTIQAAIQASLDSLDEECRDAVGRLSVFGMTCWDAGLEALGMPDVDVRMRQLSAAEVLVEQHQSRFSGSREWLFKHAMVREVIYESLGEAEKCELHGLAADWLAHVGEDASVVAGHYELAGQDERAAHFLAHAAERALATNALTDALTMAERALAFAETRQEGFHRASILDEAWSRLDPRASDRETAVSALEENVHDEPSAVLARGARARYDDARGSGEEISERLAATRDEAAALGIRDEEARCSAALASRLAFAGDFEAAGREAKRLLRLSEKHGVRYAAVDAWQTLAIVHQTQGKPSEALEARRSAAAAARSAGLREREAMLTCNLGFALTTLGARQEARESLERGLELADAIGSSGAVRHARMNLLGWTATFGGDKRLEGILSEPREDADSTASGVWAAPDRSNLGILFYRGSELLRSESPHALTRARNLLRMSTEGYRATENRDVLPVALGMWALAERKLGHLEAALALAEEAADLLDAGAPSLLNEAAVYLVLHDCYVDLGRLEDANEAAGHGMPHLVRRVRGLVGTPYARSFLTELTHNAALIACAEEYGHVPDVIHRILEGGS